MKQLAITADDFGLARELDQGIKEACVKGVVTHVSLIANGENIDEAIRFLNQHRQITAGVHLNLSDGRPLTAPRLLQPLLDKEGNFFTRRWRIMAACFRRPSLLRAIEAEYRTQMERLLASGVRLFQLNCHGHLHAIPPLFRRVIQIASDYQIPFVRVSEEWPTARLFLESSRQAVKTFLLTSSFKVSRRLVQTENRCKQNLCFGVFDSGRLTLERFEEILLRLPEGFSELVCHPGVADEEVKKRYPWDYHWDEERTLLTSERVKELIQRSQIQLVNFSNPKDASL